MQIMALINQKPWIPSNCLEDANSFTGSWSIEVISQAKTIAIWKEKAACPVSSTDPIQQWTQQQVIEYGGIGLVNQPPQQETSMRELNSVRAHVNLMRKLPSIFNAHR